MSGRGRSSHRSPLGWAGHPSSLIWSRAQTIMISRRGHPSSPCVHSFPFWFTTSTSALLKTPSQTQTLSLKTHTHKEGEREDAALADTDRTQSLNFFQPISLLFVSLCVCVYVLAPCRGCTGAKRAGVSATQGPFCSVWHLGLQGVDEVCSTVHSSDRLRLAATVWRSGPCDAPHLWQIPLNLQFVQLANCYTRAALKYCCVSVRAEWMGCNRSYALMPSSRTVG